MAKRLLPLQMVNAEFKRVEYRAEPEAGTSLEEVLQPEYWTNVAKQFRIGTKVEVFPVDGAWYADLLVTSCSNIHARVEVLLFQKIKGAYEAQASKAAEEAAPYYAKWSGPNRKWAVMRRSDSTLVTDGLDSKESAQAWIVANESDLS